jgi:hypothetical protein
MPAELDMESGTVIDIALRAYRGEELEEAELMECTFEALEAMGKQYANNLEKYGCYTWYEWANTNWGTKWNAYKDTAYWSEPDNLFVFDTAWSASLPVSKALSAKFPNVTIKHSWADEDIGSNCGIVEFLGGEEISRWIPEGEEAEKFAKELTGYEDDACDDGENFEW